MALADGRTPAILGGQPTQARAIASPDQCRADEIAVDTLYGLAQRILNGANNLNSLAYDLRQKFDDRQTAALAGLAPNNKAAVERRPTVLEILNTAEQNLVELNNSLRMIESAVGNW